ncbi:hypothetical protein [Desulfovibrio desulfuricans]|uniref:hypothetical protein n=1 Tax=Desulfovibrio desulfuricans TaxID=876 RepID=UPI001AE571EC|nr:hypothetical protein [Desulfovibrio desulfuricans]QTO39579.1 hypothetical protein J8J02_10650 [Desulfovibrio desulfuricans]
MCEIKLPDSIEHEIFIKSEYLKRHFENNADPKMISWLEEECFSPLKIFSEDILWKIIIIRECIVKHEKEKLGERYKESIPIPFDLKSFTPWIDRLLEISEKYKIYAPELLFPLDMKEALEAVKNNIPLPKQRPFDDERSREAIYQEYGYRTYEKSKRLTIELDFSDTHVSSHLAAQRIFFEIAIFKLTSGISLTDSEKMQLASLVASEKSGKFRSSSFYNRLIGLFAWDMKKEFCLGFKEIRKLLTDMNLYMYDKNFCLSAKCRDCESQDNCIKSLINNYRIAAHSIKSMKLIPTSSKLDKIYPNPKSPFLRRHPISLFE